NPDGTYNLQFIEDFIRNAIKQQVLLSKSITRAYYGMAPVYNYWNGCSTGGRQGYLLAQELGKELQGILANAPAIYWTGFSDCPDVGADRDEGSAGHADCPRQAQSGDSVRRGRV